MTTGCLEYWLMLHYKLFAPPLTTVAEKNRMLEEIRKQLGVSEKKPTTDDMLFTVETVSCLGACGLAPVCTVNDVVYPAMTPEKARDMIKEIREKEAQA